MASRKPLQKSSYSGEVYLSGSEEAVREPGGRGRRGGRGRVKHEQGKRSKESTKHVEQIEEVVRKKWEKRVKASQNSGVKLCFMTLSTPLISKTKESPAVSSSL